MSNQFSTYIDSQYLINCADYLDYMQDAVKVLGDDAFAGYIGDFLVGFSNMKERAYPAGLVVRKGHFEELGYKAEDFSVTVDDYSTFDQITELFAKGEGSLSRHDYAGWHLHYGPADRLLFR